MNIWIAIVLGVFLGHILRRLSPVFLRMKDRSMPFRLPWLEIVGGVCAAFIAWRFDGLASFGHWYIFLAFILAITATDMQAKLIPPEVTGLGTLVGLVLTMVRPQDAMVLMNQEAWLWRLNLPSNSPEIAGLVLGLCGAVAGGLLMEFIRRVFSRMVSMEVMGFGDTLIMIMMGAFLGPKLVIISLFPACIIGVIMGIVHRILFKVPHTPFGPALAGGGLLILLFNNWVVGGLEGYQTLLSNLSGPALAIFSLLLLVIAFFLIWRIRNKRLEYERQIEEDYQSIEEKIEH